MGVSIFGECMKNIDYINFDEDSVEEMPNGFMSIVANLTRTGIFVYQKVEPDGSISVVKQLRLAEEHTETMLATLHGMPLTNNHPEELVNPENAEEYIVGMASDRPKKIYVGADDADDDEKEEYLQQRLTIFNKDTIDDVKRRRKRQVSLGYQCELDFTPGVYKGENYDCIQRNIRVNHVSLVQRARGGSNCKLLLDGKEQVVNLDGVSIDDTIPKEDNVKIFVKDGKEYKVEDDVYSLLTSMQTNLDEADAKLKDQTKAVEKLTAIKDDLESKIKTQKDSDDEDAFRKAVKARVALESQASKVLGEQANLDGLSELEIKSQVVKKLRPSISLDGKSDDYVDARYEIALEDFNADDDDDDKDKELKKMGRQIQNNVDGEDPYELAEKARKAAWERDRNAYKGGK